MRLRPHRASMTRFGEHPKSPECYSKSLGKLTFEQLWRITLQTRGLVRPIYARVRPIYARVRPILCKCRPNLFDSGATVAEPPKMKWKLLNSNSSGHDIYRLSLPPHAGNSEGDCRAFRQDFTFSQIAPRSAQHARLGNGVRMGGVLRAARAGRTCDGVATNCFISPTTQASWELGRQLAYLPMARSGPPELLTSSDPPSKRLPQPGLSRRNMSGFRNSAWRSHST